MLTLREELTYPNPHRSAWCQSLSICELAGQVIHICTPRPPLYNTPSYRYSNQASILIGWHIFVPWPVIACLGGPPQVGAVMRVCWANLGAIMCHVMLPLILSSPTYTQHILYLAWSGTTSSNKGYGIKRFKDFLKLSHN